MTKAWATLAGTVALSLTIAAQQESHDYWGSQREMIRRGQDGIGCVVLAPDQTFDAIDKLPSLMLAAPAQGD